MADKIFKPEHFEKLTSCLWCEDKLKNAPLWCVDPEPFRTVQCSSCGMVFIQVRLNQKGRNEYYKRYYQDVYKVKNDLVLKREKMYDIEAGFIKSYINGGQVLDVGCSDGSFLAYFDRNKWTHWGVEFSLSPLRCKKQKNEKHFFKDELPKLRKDFKKQKFDLIMFRGVIEHVSNPKEYLETAVNLLAPKGKIFIGSTPNRDSLCANLFRDKWNQHCPESHIFHFSPNDFKQFFKKSFRLIGEKYFYLETPYANIDSDLELIKRALNLKSHGKGIGFKSPAFFGNMMTLMFEKSSELKNSEKVKIV